MWGRGSRESIRAFGRATRVMLVNPTIPQNTGNIGRTCVGLDMPLTLIGDLGFSLSTKALRRAGLDYWPALDVDHLPSFSDAVSAHPSDRFYFLTKFGQTSLLDADFWPPSLSSDDPEKDRRMPGGSGEGGSICLVFGSEISGLGSLLEEHPHMSESPHVEHIAIPQTDDIRCFNLASSAATVAWEAYRQFSDVHSQHARPNVHSQHAGPDV